MLVENNWVVLNDKSNYIGKSGGVIMIGLEDMRKYGFIVENRGFIAVNCGEDRPRTPRYTKVYDKSLPFHEDPKRRVITKSASLEQVSARKREG